MVEALGPSLEDIGEATVDIPALEVPDSGVADPIRKANFWYESQLAQMEAELNECYKQEGKSQAEQTIMTERIGQIAAEKKALKRVDCPELSPKEQELVEAHDELQELADQVSRTWQLMEKHKNQEFLASQYKNDLVQLNGRMTAQNNHIKALELDLQREKR